MVAFADATNAWWRPSDLPAETVKKEFLKFVEDSEGSLNPNVFRVVVKSLMMLKVPSDPGPFSRLPVLDQS